MPASPADSHIDLANEDVVRRLVIVSGPGRSGTSTVSGSLAQLGYVVPPPVLRSNSANPRGYFEPTWVVNFHKRVLAKASIQTMDSRPWGPDLVQAVVDKEPLQKELTSWLGRAFDSESRLVVKDPRAFWLRELWFRAATEVGAEASVLTMLRHPAEVIGSRDTHYDSGNPEDVRIARLIRNLAGWINSTLINEKTSRGHRRAFLQYGDLLTDWRAAMRSIDNVLNLGLSHDHLDGSDHPIDDFIDPTLHRVHVTWADLQLPDYMREIAQSVWDIVSEDHAGLSIDPVRYESLDSLSNAYRRSFNDAVALAGDEISTRTRQARQSTKRQVTNELRQEYEERLSTAKDDAIRASSSAESQPSEEHSDEETARPEAGVAEPRAEVPSGHTSPSRIPHAASAVRRRLRRYRRSIRHTLSRLHEKYSHTDQ